MSDRDEFEKWFDSATERRRLIANVGPGTLTHTLALEAWQAARRWRPIEEAPKDSARGFIAGRQGQPSSAMHVIAVDGDLLTMTGMTKYRDVTHWMPLPEPPQE